MASYTLQLRTYIEGFSQYDEGLSLKEKIEIGRQHLFDFDYPIFDEAYRKVFETNLIRNFYMREIGFETEELFKFYLENFLVVNMPYYNKMWQSELIDYDPLINSEMQSTENVQKDKGRTDVKDRTDISNTLGEASNVEATDSTITDNSTSTVSGTESVDTSNVEDVTSSSTGTSSSDKTNFDRKISSNNPDSRLQLTAEDGVGVIEYANEIDENRGTGTENTDTTSSGTGKVKNTGSVGTTSSSTTTNSGTSDNVGTVTTNSDSKVDSTVNSDETLTSNINEIEDYIQHRKGKIGAVSYSKLLMEYRQALIRVEKIIHNDMQELFMLVY